MTMLATIKKQEIKNKTWLVIGCVSLFLVIIFWFLQGENKIITSISPDQEVDRPIQAETVGSHDTLGMFTNEVIPLDLTKRIAKTGLHDAEFRGLKFVENNQNKWTLQLMTVSEEDLIRTYLAKRDDRNKFHYLRLQDGKNPEQYVLNYGVFDTAQEATTQLQQMNFALPSSVRITPIKISSFRDKVNDMGSEELLSGKLYTVKLNKTSLPRPKPVEAPQSQTEPTKETSSRDLETTPESKPSESSNNTTHRDEIKESAPVKEEKKPTVINRWSGSGQVEDPF